MKKSFFQTIILDLPFGYYDSSYFYSFVNRHYHGDIRVVNINCSQTHKSFRVIFQIQNKENALVQAINPFLVQKLYDEAMECGLQIVYEISQYFDTSRAQAGVEFDAWNQRIGYGHSHPFQQLSQHFNYQVGRFNGVGHHGMYNNMINQMGFRPQHQHPHHYRGNSSDHHHGYHGGYHRGSSS